jgi:hypothetical protein
MKWLSLWLLAATLLLVSGCTSMMVKTDYDRQANFSQYRSFGWLNQSQEPNWPDKVQQSLMEARVKRAVERELKAKGFFLIEKGRPDLCVAYHVGVKDKIDIQHYGYGHWRRPAVGTKVYHYKEGALVLDFIDPVKKQLIWRGWAVAQVDDPEQIEEHVNQAVGRIIAHYPPQ